MSAHATGARGVSATSHPLASLAALEMYAMGGTAIDAGIAAAFALTVVEPYASSLAGHGCLLLRTAQGDIVALDYLSACPSDASEGMFEWIESPTLGGYRFETKHQANAVGPLSITPPTAVPAWCSVLDRYGTLSLTQVLGPAIRMAEEGFTVDRVCAERISQNVKKLRLFPEAAATWLDQTGRSLAAGRIVRQPALAATLRRLLVDGPEVFVSGDVARVVCDGVQASGGVLALPDLARAASNGIRWQTPVRTTLGGTSTVVYSMPPASTGGLTVCELLNILAAARAAEASEEDWIHLFIESTKLALADRAAYAGDPDTFPIPTSVLASPDFAASRAAALDLRRAGTYAIGALADVEDDTTHHTHADIGGNVFACTQSLGDPFGSGVMAPGTGVLLNNLMKLFDPRPNRRNSIRPGQKIFSSMAPTLVLSEGRPVLALGSPSGTRIITAVAYVSALRLFRNIPLQNAVAAPRVHWSGEELEIEEGLAQGLIDALRRRGHNPILRDAGDPWFGAVQAVEFLPRELRGVSDARRAGSVMAAGMI